MIDKIQGWFLSHDRQRIECLSLIDKGVTQKWVISPKRAEYCFTVWIFSTFKRYFPFWSLVLDVRVIQTWHMGNNVSIIAEMSVQCKAEVWLIVKIICEMYLPNLFLLM